MAIKVLFLTIGTETIASSRTRVYQYVSYIEEAGIQCIIIPMTNATKKSKFRAWRLIKRKFNNAIKYPKIALFSIVCDVVFIQKVLLPIWMQNLVRVLNRNIIFDFVDAIWASHQTSIHQNNALGRLLLTHIISISKFVILENSYTREFTMQFNKNILMITGPIDCKRYFAKRREKNKNIVIGWIGNPSNTLYLKPLFSVFKRISKNYPNVVIELIGASNLEIEGVNLVIKEWNLDTEVENLHDFDIGIMPLPNDEWSRGKGGYKLLQYMAVGIPSVASPVGINSVLIKKGVNGYLANSEGEWYDKLEILIKDEGLRKSIGASGRKFVEEQYSLKLAAPKLIKLLQEIRTK